MATVKIVLRKKPNKDGTLPLCLRITKDRKTSFIHLGYSLKEKDWDAESQKVKRTYPNHVRMNNFILKKLSEATDNSLELEASSSSVTVKAVREKLKPNTGLSFFCQADNFLEQLKSQGKYNQYTSDKPRIEHFKDFLGNNDIAFADITVGLLERFRSYLKKLKPYSNRPHLSERTIMNHFVVLRSVYAHARKNGVITKEQSPFGENGIKIKFPDSLKVGLTIEEVSQLENAELTDPAAIHARNLWLFSFYFAGIRVSDLLRIRWTDIQNDRLHYSMGKNNKGGSLKMSEKAIKILKQYEHLKEKKDDLIFPELKECNFDNKFLTQRTIAFKTSAVDKCLRLHVAPAAGIDKKLTMHIARHSFAQNAGDIDVRTLQHLFRHSKLETTEGYMGQFRFEKADDALDAVLSLNKSN